MKLKDIKDKNINVQNIKLKLPKRVLKQFQEYGGGESEMYPVGDCMGYGFMMSPQSPEVEPRSLYPLPPDVSQSDLLEWQVVK